MFEDVLHKLKMDNRAAESAVGAFGNHTNMLSNVCCIDANDPALSSGDSG